MKILFYHNTIKKHEVVSANVHIIEVLNNLTKLGHIIRYANGKQHSFTLHSPDEGISPSPLRISYWEKVKRFIWTLPFRGEALISLYFINEIRLILSAFITILRFRPDIIYRRHTIFNSEIFLSKIFRIPCVRETNSLVGDEFKFMKKGDAFSQWLTNVIEKIDFRIADKYVAVTESLRDTLLNNFNVPVGKITVIENGVNTDLFKPMDEAIVQKELNLDISSRYICFVGGLAEYHGVKYFISAMPYILKEHPEARALIIGESQMRTRLVKNELIGLSNQLGVFNMVKLTGRVPYEKVPWYINASEICVIPSWWSGQNQRIGLSSLKLCEYLACGKPVIASRISGFEFIEEIDCGYLVKPASKEELALAIIRLLNDPASEDRMGKNGRKYVVENRSWESVAKKVASVCDSTLENHNTHNR